MRELDMSSAAIYAGTFDPLTLGHTDLVERGAEIFDRLILAISVKSRKDALFTIEERLDMARAVVGKYGSVEVDSFDCLLVDYAHRKGVRVLLRGLRAYSDFDYEFPMALTNRNLAPEIETLFMMPKEAHSFISSSTVRELARFGGDTSRFVPPEVHQVILKKMNRI
jgi:pantetheine-phosphate adenylyltransferase